nr:uncharacterized protein LOC111414489 isoform X2 [Onthophagus taurus]
MKCYVSFLCILSLFFAISHAAPAISAAIGSQGSGAVDPTELLMRISDKFSQNIQILRRFCPPLFQIIDNVVQNVTSQLFSVVGRVVLRSGLGGGLGGGGGESMVSVVLPTFPPDDDEESTEVMEVSTIPEQPVLIDESYVRRIDSEPTTQASIILPPAPITTNQAPITSSSQAPIELPLSVNEIRVDSDEQALYTENKTDSALEDRIASIYKGLELQDTKDIIETFPAPENDDLSIKVVQEGEIVNQISLTVLLLKKSFVNNAIIDLIRLLTTSLKQIAQITFSFSFINLKLFT